MPFESCLCGHGQDAKGFVRREHNVGYFCQRSLHFGMLDVPRMPHRQRQIGGADEDDINPGNLDDMGQGINRLGRLHLHNDHSFLIAEPDMVGIVETRLLAVVGGA